MTFAARNHYGARLVTLPAGIDLIALDSVSTYEAFGLLDVYSDGTLDAEYGTNNEPSTVDTYTWFQGADASLFSIRLTGTGDAPNTGGLSLNTWYPLTTSPRRFGWTQSGLGALAFTGTLEIALTASTSNVLGSSAIGVDVACETGS